MRHDRNSGYERSIAPVKVGDELDVKIEAVGEKGDGIAKKDGFVLFVPNTKKDDNVKIRVTKVLQKVGFAEVVGPGSQENESSGSEQKEESNSSSEEAPQQESYSSQDSEDFGEE